MEKPNKQEKHKMAIRVGGGGGGVVGGVVLWGGVVAVATFLSVSAIRLRKRPTNKSHNPPPPPPPPKPTSSSQFEAEPIADLSDKLELKKKKNNDDDQGKGLHVLLQDYSPPIDYHPSTDGTTEMPVTRIDSTSSDFTKASILDDNSVLDISGPTKNPTYLEILLSDNSKPKNSLLITDYGVNVQEYSLPVLDRPSLLKSGNKNKNEHIGDKVDVEEDNTPMELIEKGGGGEVEEHDDVENTIEIGEVVVETDLVNQFSTEGDSIVSEVIWEDKAVEAPPVGRIEEVDNRHTQLIETVIEKGEETIDTAEKDQFEVEVDQEAIKVAKEEAANEATDAVHIEAEYNPELQLIEEEQENDDGGIAVEKDEAIETVVQTNQVAVDQDELQVTVLSEDEPQVTVLSEDEDEDEDEDDDEMDVNEDEDEDEEEIVEKGEESSDGTGDSSMESNAEAIWPAESIQELSLEFKELKIINKTLDDKIDETEDHGCYSNSITDEGNIYVNGHHNNEETGKSIVTASKGSMKKLLARIKLSTDSSNTRIWIWPSLVLLVLLLLLVMPLLLSPANVVKLCLIIFLVVILSQV